MIRNSITFFLITITIIINGVSTLFNQPIKEQKMCRLRNCTVVVDNRNQVNLQSPLALQKTVCETKNEKEFCLGVIGPFEFVELGIESTNSTIEDYNDQMNYVGEQNELGEEIQSEIGEDGCPKIWDPVCCHQVEFGRIVGQQTTRKTFENECAARNDKTIWFACSKGPCQRQTTSVSSPLIPSITPYSLPQNELVTSTLTTVVRNTITPIDSINSPTTDPSTTKPTPTPTTSTMLPASSLDNSNSVSTPNPAPIARIASQSDGLETVEWELVPAYQREVARSGSVGTIIEHQESTDLDEVNCLDVAPDEAFTCQEQLYFDKCNAPWMLEEGFCRKTCGKCAPNYRRKLLGNPETTCSLDSQQLPPCCEEYVVRLGQTLEYISNKFDISIQNILLVNGMSSEDIVMQGDIIQIC